mmetsp:Transcript_340/g.818  ORF Transcript_340/g.818 Transcript_340/m.818 type:complete len:172 (-) Transcript_340:109-624(-)
MEDGGWRMEENRFCKELVLRVRSNQTPMHLNVVELDNQEMPEFVAALAKDQSLVSLDLSCNKINDNGARALENVLGKHKYLKSLNISYNKIGKNGAMALAKQTLDTHNLESLDLSWNQMGDKGVILFAEALSNNPRRLEFLNISWNEIGEKGAAALANMWTKNPILKDLRT